MRKTYEELEELKKQFNTDRLWSWSRKNCVHNSLYEYFLRYIKHEKEDRQDSIYVITGGMSHNIIEDFYSNKITKEQMVEEFDDAWITAFDISELKFNRSDTEKNNNIADKYYKDLKHFFQNHIVITDKILLEQFVTVKVGEEYFQGYIDALVKDKDGNFTIIDWKSSSIYLGEKAKNECGQLVLYAMALHQMGIPYDKIRIAWDFLKYTNVYVDTPVYINLRWTTAKGEQKEKLKLDRNKLISTLKASVKALLKADGYSKEDIESFISIMEETNNIDKLPDTVKSKISIEKCNIEVKPRQIERAKIGESLAANVKAQMKKLGYNEDDIFTYLDQLAQTNDIKCLPKDVQDKYRFEDCFVYVELTDELIKHWEDDIISTLKMIREKEAEYENTHDESIWMESLEDVKANSFYFSNLCAYSANKHKPYKMYLQTLETEKNGDLLNNNKQEDSIPEDDYSWLEGLI